MTFLVAVTFFPEKTILEVWPGFEYASTQRLVGYIEQEFKIISILGSVKMSYSQEI